MTPISFHSQLEKWSQAENSDDLTNQVLGPGQQSFKALVIKKNPSHEANYSPIKIDWRASDVCKKISQFLSENSDMLTKSDLPALENLQAIAHIFSVRTKQNLAQDKEGKLATLEKTIANSIKIANSSPILMDSAQFHTQLVKWSLADDTDDLANKVLGGLQKSPIKDAAVALGVSHKIEEFLNENSNMLGMYDIPALENLQALVHMFTVQTKHHSKEGQVRMTALEKIVADSIKIAYDSKIINFLPNVLNSLTAEHLTMREAIDFLLNGGDISPEVLKKSIASASREDIKEFVEVARAKSEASPYVFNTMIHTFFKHAPRDKQADFFSSLNNRDRDFLSKIIPAMPRDMTELNLKPCQYCLEPSHIKQIISHFDNLESLNLANCDLDNEIIIEIANSPKMNNLKTLVLDKITGIEKGIIEIANSPNMFSLQNLSLAGCLHGDDVVFKIVNSPYMSNLISLNVHNCHLGTKAIVAIAESTHMAELKHLNISLNSLDVKAINALAKSYNMARMEYLYLSNCYLEDDSVTALANGRMSKLKGLDLGSTGGIFYNSIGNASILALVNSPNFSELEHLDLEDGVFDDTAISAMADGIYLRKLKNLNLSGNWRLTDEGISTIATSLNFKELEKLNFSGCHLTEAAILAMITSVCTTKLHHLIYEGIEVSPETSEEAEAILGPRWQNMLVQGHK